LVFAHKETMDQAINQTGLPEVLQQCWTLLTRGKADRRHGFHHPVVSSVTAEGKPRSRVVILRGVDVPAQTLRFHTDVRSAKWQELAERPAISMLFYDAGARVQLRVDGAATMHDHDDIAEAAWGFSQRMSRVCYGSMPGPGMAIKELQDYALPASDEAISAGRVNFGAVVVKVEQIEWLFLKSLQNQRAHFNVLRGTSSWLVP
jgi:pyridoxamine 5'-phosphate oxidase